MNRLTRGAIIQPAIIIRNGFMAMNRSLCERPAPNTAAERVCVLESGIPFVLANKIKAVEVRVVTYALKYPSEYISDPTRFIWRELRKNDPNAMATTAMDICVMSNPLIATIRAREFAPAA
jgi:hypothetical protein